MGTTLAFSSTHNILFRLPAKPITIQLPFQPGEFGRGTSPSPGTNSGPTATGWLVFIVPNQLSNITVALPLRAPLLPNHVAARRLVNLLPVLQLQHIPPHRPIRPLLLRILLCRPTQFRPLHFLLLHVLSLLQSLQLPANLFPFRALSRSVCSWLHFIRIFRIHVGIPVLLPVAPAPSPVFLGLPYHHRLLLAGP